MKGFLRSKLTLILIALVLLTGGAAVPLLSIARSHAQAPASRQVFILLKGTTSSLSDGEVSSRMPDGFQSIMTTIKATAGFSGAEFFPYSYNGIRAGKIASYDCSATIDPSINDDVSNLQEEINFILKQKPGVDTNIYLIGHSGGGAVAYAYLGFLLKGIDSISIPSNAHLKAVVTLDSPIGGISFDPTYGSFLQGYVSFKCLTVFNADTRFALDNFFSIFKSASKTPAPDDGPPGSDPQGAQATVLDLVLQTDLSNEMIAEQAATKGISVLAIGNTNDFLWKTKACNSAFPDFVNTQYLEDEGASSGIYGRSFNGTPTSCPQFSTKTLKSCTDTDLTIGGLAAFPPEYFECIIKSVTFALTVGQAITAVANSHSAVLTDSGVLTGLQKFFVTIPTTGVGGTPDNLTPQPRAD